MPEYTEDPIYVSLVKSKAILPFEKIGYYICEKKPIGIYLQDNVSKETSYILTYPFVFIYDSKYDFLSPVKLEGGNCYPVEKVEKAKGMLIRYYEPNMLDDDLYRIIYVTNVADYRVLSYTLYLLGINNVHIEKKSMTSLLKSIK